jgi:uncharacterized protein (DUF58 family)
MELGRVERGEVLRLGRRNLYIFPSRFGGLWLAGVLVQLLLGFQLGSNGPLLLGFLMLALFLLTLPLSHRNLEGLELRCGSPRPGFRDGELVYPLLVSCRRRCEGLRLRLGEEAETAARSLARGEHVLRLAWRAHRRGRQRPGRLRLRSQAPLGLFVCWCRWDPPCHQLVLPARHAGPVRRLEQGEGEGAEGPRHEGSDHWRDLRPHRPGDSGSRTAWKLLARGRGRHVKTFRDRGAAAILLAPDESVPFEQALEHLCAQICRLEAQKIPYGLVLASQSLPVGSGSAHRDRCLAALALAR